MDHIPRIDTPRAYQLAFPAKHTFCNLFSDSPGFTPLYQQVYFPGIKICEPGCRTGSGATSATYTPFEGGFVPGYKPGDRKVVFLEINLSPF
jgi:hypothetical protein